MAQGIVTRLIELEGALIAQRKLLLRLTRGAGERAAIADWLSDRAAFQGGDEDPGLMPSAEYALQAAVAEEFRKLANALED